MRQTIRFFILLLLVPLADLTAKEILILKDDQIARTKLRGSYARATYNNRLKRRVETAEGYIRTVDDSTLTIGLGLYREKIAYRDILRLIAGPTPAAVLRMERAVVKMESSKDVELSGLKAGAGWGYLFAAPGGLAWSSGAVGMGHRGSAEMSCSTGDSAWAPRWATWLFSWPSVKVLGFCPSTEPSMEPERKVFLLSRSATRGFLQGGDLWASGMSAQA